MEFTDFLTIDYISTFMGTVAVTMLVVQFLTIINITFNKILFLSVNSIL